MRPLGIFVHSPEAAGLTGSNTTYEFVLARQAKGRTKGADGLSFLLANAKFPTAHVCM